MDNTERNYAKELQCDPAQKEHIEFADNLAFQIIRKYSAEEQHECISQIRFRVLDEIEKRIAEAQINIEYLKSQHARIRKQSE